MRKITYWLALTLIFILPWEDSISLASIGSMVRLVGLIVAAFWVATMLIEGRFRRPHTFHAAVLLFFLWNFASVIWTANVESTLQRMKTYSQIFLLMLIFWELFQKPEDLMAGLQVYIYGSYVLISGTIYNFISGNTAVAYEGRYSAVGVNANDLTIILMLGLPIAMQLFFVAGQSKHGTLKKLINLAYIPLAIYAAVLTGSRTFLFAVIPFGLYLIGTQKIKIERKALVLSILLVALSALLPFVPSSVMTRLGTLGASIESGDLGGRVELWREAVSIFSEHSLTGLGSGTLDSVMGSAAHNTFLSVAAETGFIGLVLFFAILMIVLFKAINIPNGNSGLWIAIFLTWVVGVCSLSWEFRKLTWLFLSFVVIEGSFTYDQLHLGQVKAEVSASVKEYFGSAEPEVEA